MLRTVIAPMLDDGIGNWVESRVDIGFRLGISPQDGVIARRLFAVQLIICAAPDYLKRHGAPENLYELGAHRCSVYRHPATGAVLPWRVNVGGAPTELHVAPAFCTNDEDLELDAVLCGQVIAQLAAPTAAKLIRNGQLVPILIDHVADNSSLFIYYGSRSALPARTRAFIDFVVERLTNSMDFVLSKTELEARSAQ